MSIRVYTGLTCPQKQNQIIDHAHQISLSEGGKGEVVYLFPQVAIAQEFAHDFSHKLSLNDASYSFNRWFEKLWEQFGSAQAIISRDEREEYILLISQAITEAKKSQNANYILLPGVQRMLASIVGYAGKALLSLNMRQQIASWVGQDAAEVLEEYFSYIENHYFIEGVDAMRYLSEQSLRIEDVIVFDGFNDFTPAQLKFLTALSTQTDVILALNYSEANSWSAPLKSIIDNLELSCEVSVVETQCAQESSSESLLRWRNFFDQYSSDDHERLIREGALGVYLAAGRAAEEVALVTATKEALKKFRYDEITIAFPQKTKGFSELRRLFEQEGIALSYDFVMPLQESALGRAALELLSGHPTLHALSSVQRPLNQMPAPLGLTSYFSASSSADMRQLFDLDARVRSMTDDFSTAQFLAQRVWSETHTTPALTTLLNAAVSSGKVEQFKKLFDAMLARLLKQPNLTAYERDEAALAHHELLRILSLMSDGDGSAKDARVHLGSFMSKLRSATLKFSQPSSDKTVALADIARLRGRKVPCLIVGGLAQENFIVTRSRTVIDEIDDMFARVNGEEPKANNKTADASALMLHEVIAAAQNRLVLVGQCANEQGVPKSLAPFFELVVGVLDGRPQEREIDNEYHDLIERIARVRAKGAHFINPSDPVVAAARLTVGGSVSLDQLTPIEIPTRGARVLPLYEGETFSEHEFSPSSLERYAVCPYRWFIECFVPQNNLDRKYTATERGTHIHGVLREFYESWRELYGDSRITPHNYAEAHLHLNETIEAYFKKHLPRLRVSENPAHHEFLANIARRAELRVRADMSILYEEPSQETLGISFSPYAFELGLGKGTVGEADDGTNPHPVVGDVKIAGSIDRVDRSSEGYLFVLDYKGKLDHHPTGAKWFEALDIQIATYLLALQNVSPERVAGAAYLSYEGKGDTAYLVDEELIEPSIIRTKMSRGKASFHEVLSLIEPLVSTSAHLMFEGNVSLPMRGSLNGHKLSDTNMGCKFCAFQECPVYAACKEGER